MAGKHKGLPRASGLILKKSNLLRSLRALDQDAKAVKRVLAMETDFRARIQLHVDSLPLNDASFEEFNTNPFVLLFHTLAKGYSQVSQIEEDILPAKVFSSMETSAGRMVERVVLPAFGWECVDSEMHSCESVIDGRRKSDKLLRLATLKSGPRCLNDEMSENIADAVLSNVVEWAETAGVKQVDFTYGVLYGTKKQSNKKDWHVLRNIAKKIRAAKLTVHPRERWDCAFVKKGVSVTVTIRVGMELWDHLAQRGWPFFEMACALIRACVVPKSDVPRKSKYVISDLGDIVSRAGLPADFNVSILQRSQWEWLFFFARHFCDELSQD